MHVSDERVLLRGTAANVVGLLAGVAAAFGVQVLLGRTLPAGGLALVTIAVQIAFVASAGARFGMDVAAVRLVAIAEGADDPTTLRSLVDRCAGIAIVASIVVAVVIAAAAPLTGDQATRSRSAPPGCPSSPSRTCTSGATRGLKPDGPDAVRVLDRPAGAVDRHRGRGDRSRRGEQRGGRLRTVPRGWWPRSRRGRCGGAACPPAWATSGRPARRCARRSRYGVPRAPSALLAQALFWADLFVLAHYIHGAEARRVCRGGTRVAVVLLLFVISTSLIFAPFAAELHARGETARLDELFKKATRWAVAATCPRRSCCRWPPPTCCACSDRTTARSRPRFGSCSSARP